MNISDRANAKKLGKKTYITGRPCKHGHMSEKTTVNGCCVECRRNDKEGAARRQNTFKSKNPERLKEIKRISMAKAREENHEKHREYARLRMKRINATKSGKLNQFVKGALRKCLISKKNKRSFNVLGYSKNNLVKRIECQFKKGMTWGNYGEWHIDHKKPISRFLKDGVSDPRIINALSNLQPLWAFENRSKGDKF